MIRKLKPSADKETIGIIFSDSKSGLSRITAEIIQDNKGQILADKKISEKGTKQETLPLTISAGELNLHDGPATIKVTATDYSLFKNQAVLSQQIKIDTVPPQINLLKNINYINQGGTGFVAYQPSKALSSTGVYINDYLSPAHAILIDNKPSYITYFALPMNANKTSTRIMVFARDEAGNETNYGCPLRH